MSYCRWSTDNFTCDLYVYYSGSEPDQITIHVASNKGKPDHIPIGLPCDGESYDLEPKEAVAKIRELIAMGYRCNPSVADRIAEEFSTETEQ